MRRPLRKTNVAFESKARKEAVATTLENHSDPACRFSNPHPFKAQPLTFAERWLHLIVQFL
jgi:hypothetical protein